MLKVVVEVLKFCAVLSELFLVLSGQITETKDKQTGKTTVWEWRIVVLIVVSGIFVMAVQSVET
jgi:hypothetical protein